MSEVTPEPVEVEVCSVCDLPWRQHEDLTKYWDEEEDDYESGEYKYGVVGLEQCVKLLLRRFQGPVGPVGATGAMGSVDWDSKRVRGDIETVVREYLTRRTLS